MPGGSHQEEGSVHAQQRHQSRDVHLTAGAVDDHIEGVLVLSKALRAPYHAVGCPQGLGLRLLATVAEDGRHLPSTGHRVLAATLHYHTRI